MPSWSRKVAENLLNGIKMLTEGNEAFPDSSHARVHNGNLYSATAFDASVADDGNLSIVLTTPASSITFVRVIPSSGGLSDFEMYEGTEFSGGSAVSAINHLRSSANTFSGSAVEGPSVSETGTFLLQSLLPGGQGSLILGPSANGFFGVFENEYGLSPSTDYLFRVINRSGDSVRSSLTLTFYNE